MKTKNSFPSSEHGTRWDEFDPQAVSLRGTHLIEASAGTGKTHNITTLYLRLLLEAELAVDQILVVTFTNAATAELRARIRKRTHELLLAMDGTPALRKSDDDLCRFAAARKELGRTTQDRRLLNAALQGFDQSAVFTIHGFCQRMLQENAFESGIPFDLDVLEDQSLLIEQIVRDFWIRSLYDAPRPFLKYLGSLANPLGHLQRLADLLQTHRDIQVLSELQRGETPEAVRWQQMQFDCMQDVRVELKKRKHAMRVHSFDDLLQHTATALRGETGGLLSERIRRRFPAALIDEFQDTDPVQYEIFRRIYHEDGRPLFLIGDPKQAIYAFRGADVFAYLAARSDASQVHTLRRNWRSDPRLITAINHLFGDCDAPFLLRGIPYHRVSAVQADRFVDPQPDRAPFEVLFCTRTGVEGARGLITKTWANKSIAHLIAAEIVRFVASGATIGGRPVTYSDIAVLCRKNKQSRAVQDALRALGVPSALQSESSVFSSNEAEEIGRIIRAIADPGDAPAVRAALVTRILGRTASQLAALQEDEQAWDEWLRKFQDWNGIWRTRGFMTAFRSLLDGEQVVPRLLEWIDGERRLTNVLHLAELLHSAGIEGRLSPDGLIRWFDRMMTDEMASADLAREAAQIRLESDDSAVQLVTIHKSKGLEYPIVYCPFLWDSPLLHKEDQRMPRFHDPDDRYRLKLDLGIPPFDGSVQRAMEESAAENLRLLYVALTRAKHRCTVVWGAFSDGQSSALAYVLHAQPGMAESWKERAARIQTLMKAGDDQAMLDDLKQLVARAEGTIALRTLAREMASPVVPAESAAGSIACRTVERIIDRSWRTASFSSLIRTTSVGEPASEGVDYDMSGPAPPPEPTNEEPIRLHEFPAGTRVGQFLHHVLEKLDPADDATVLREQVIQALEYQDLETRWADVVVSSLREILDTPLDPSGLRLRDIPETQRLTEMEFLLPVESTASFPDPAGEDATGCAGVQRGCGVLPEHLARVFDQYGRTPIGPKTAARIAQLGFRGLQGFLRGFIDLVFRHDGRWYIADYKSNHLGPDPGAYTPERLWPEMLRHHYTLQYHLYTVALHRYLKHRLPGYEYERDFGGVYYLFLRGMSPDYAAGNGIFADRPPWALVQGLSEVFAGGIR